jgi:hypothetical protein
MGRKKRESNFWVSYSDLSTGMMIIFMVVMLLMVAIQKMKSAAQQDAVEQIVARLQVILGAKPKVSEAIEAGFQKSKSKKLNDLEIDSVTAQFAVQNTNLTFKKNKHKILDEGKDFLREFTPAYLCALWNHEDLNCSRSAGSQADKCNRLRPDATGAIRRIMVTGSADLYGKDFAGNNELSALRAKQTVGYMAKHLEALAGDPTGTEFEQYGFVGNPRCTRNADRIWAYAQERLWAVGAGDSQHCSSVLNEGNIQDCSKGHGEEGKNKDYRRVTFELDVTGDDMTGFLLNVLELMGTLDLDPSRIDYKRLQDAAKAVSKQCWDGAGDNAGDVYDGCPDFIDYCLRKGNKTDEPSTLADMFGVCNGFWASIEQGNHHLIGRAEDVCNSNKYDACETLRINGSTP